MNKRQMGLWADLLTLSRGIGIPVFFIMLAAERIASLTTLFIILTIGFYTDVFDGILGRRGEGEIGDKDVFFDVPFLISAMFYTAVVFSFPLLLKLAMMAAAVILAVYTAISVHRGYIWGKFQIIESWLMLGYACSILVWVAKDSIYPNFFWDKLLKLPEAWCMVAIIVLCMARLGYALPKYRKLRATMKNL